MSVREAWRSSRPTCCRRPRAPTTRCLPDARPCFTSRLICAPIPPTETAVNNGPTTRSWTERGAYWRRAGQRAPSSACSTRHRARPCGAGGRVAGTRVAANSPRTTGAASVQMNGCGTSISKPTPRARWTPRSMAMPGARRPASMWSRTCPAMCSVPSSTRRRTTCGRNGSARRWRGTADTNLRGTGPASPSRRCFCGTSSTCATSPRRSA